MEARQIKLLALLMMTACSSHSFAADAPAATSVPMTTTSPGTTAPVASAAAPSAPQPAAAPVSAPVDAVAATMPATVPETTAQPPAATTEPVAPAATAAPSAATIPAPAVTPASNAPTQSTPPTPTPEAMASADDSKCPCDYSQAEAVAIFNATPHGAIMCSLGSVKMIGEAPAANGLPVQPTNTALLMTIDKDKASGAKDQSEAAKISMTTWLAGFGGDPTKESTNYCTKNKWDPAAKKDILTLKQYQSCLQDIKQAARAVGLTCGEE